MKTSAGKEEIMKYSYQRSHQCGELRIEDKEKEVSLSGWIHRRRDHGGLIFIDLRDKYGITQLVLDPVKTPVAHTLRSEWVINAKGIVHPRAHEMINEKLETGKIEIKVVNMEILSKSHTPPFSLCDEHIETHEEIRLHYRYLDIRRGKIANNLLLRHNVMMTTRNFLDKEGFIEISTPILGKSTPEGARDYIVPSRVHPGSFYALPQSPQLFKQLLMIAGTDRYFQIAPCFRDEDLRADRQPEFTQIDIEMSFGHPDQLMNIIERLLKAVFERANILFPDSIPKLTYRECIDRYGTDKPDTRFGMELVDITDIGARSNFSVFKDQIDQENIVKAIRVKNAADLSRKNIEDYTAFVGNFGISGLAWMRMENNALNSNIVKFFDEELQKELITRMQLENNDLLLMIANEPGNTNQALDHLRRRIATERNLIDPKLHNFLWVTDFPLFDFDEHENRLVSMHHPFTSPHPDDIALIDTKPLSVRSSGYDIVLNGYEIGGGSQRIHNSDLQRKIFSSLNINETEQQNKFGFFLEALEFGTPPHLGIALGLDRLLMILSGTNNIKDVIAFPKTQKASDLMMHCPSEVSQELLNELSIETIKDNLTQKRT